MKVCSSSPRPFMGQSAAGVVEQGCVHAGAAGGARSPERRLPATSGSSAPYSTARLPGSSFRAGPAARQAFPWNRQHPRPSSTPGLAQQAGP